MRQKEGTVEVLSHRYCTSLKMFRIILMLCNRVQQVDKQMTFIPFQVGVMSGQNIFHQGDSCVVGFSSQLLGKVEFSTQEVSNWPQPLLLTHTHTK